MGPFPVVSSSSSSSLAVSNHHGYSSAGQGWRCQQETAGTPSGSALRCDHSQQKPLLKSQGKKGFWCSPWVLEGPRVAGGPRHLQGELSRYSTSLPGRGRRTQRCAAAQTQTAAAGSLQKTHARTFHLDGEAENQGLNLANNLPFNCFCMSAGDFGLSLVAKK